MFNLRKLKIKELEQEKLVLHSRIKELEKENSHLLRRLEDNYGLLGTNCGNDLPFCEHWYCSSCSKSKKLPDGHGGFCKVCMNDIPCEGFVYNPIPSCPSEYRL